MKNKEQHTFPFIERLLDGAEVEWKKLGEVFETRNGYTPSKANGEFWNNGTIPWFRMEDIRTNGHILKDSILHITPKAIKGKGLFKADSIIMATTATIGEHALLIADSLANQQFTNFNIRKSLSDKLTPKFVYYYFFVIDEWCKQNVNVSSFPSVEIERLKKLPFPIPPLSVQERIVEILDKFTTLEAELEAELDCRKRQYEFYRNQLLTFDILNKECIKVGKRKVMPLGEIVTIKNGKSYKHLSMGNIPVYGSGGIMCFVDEYVYNKPSVLIPRKGSLENIFYIEEPFWNVDTIFYTEINDKIIMPKFLYYYLLNQHLEKLNLAGGVPSLTQKVLNKILIPIPPLAEQERIVSILDKFDTLTTSISEGLPKEIELRRKQYEYYRERLLSFKH